MKSTLKCILLFLLISFISSCQKEYSISGLSVSGNDADAEKFIATSNINNIAQENAINNLVTQLKDAFLWPKFIAIYPMIGGTASTAKWNLKDPRDADAAYRLTFYGNPAFDSAGVLFPSASDYADTHLMDNMVSAFNNAISYYSTTQNTVDGYDMGCSDNTYPYNEFTIYNSSDATDWFGYYSFGRTPASTIGLFMISSTANDVKRYDNGVLVDAKASSPKNVFTNLPILLGTVSNAVSGGQRECGFATIGESLSDSEASTFYNIVKTFETAVGRK